MDDANNSKDKGIVQEVEPHPKVPRDEDQQAYRSSFVDTKKTKIQLTWKNIVISAPPKSGGMFNKTPPDAKHTTIIGKFSDFTATLMSDL